MSGQSAARARKIARIAARDGFGCRYCGAAFGEGNPVTLDHVIPRCRGGGNHDDNMVLACYDCNHDKGASDWEPGSRPDRLPPRLRGAWKPFEDLAALLDLSPASEEALINDQLHSL